MLMNHNLKNLAAGAGIFIFTFAVYLYTIVPSVTGDDSGELAGACATLGTAHSPGYPVYCLAGKSAVTMVPWGNKAYRVNIVSAFFLSLTNLVLFVVILKTSGRLFVSAPATLLFAFSEPAWGMANVTEVYGVAALVASLIYLAMTR